MSEYEKIEYLYNVKFQNYIKQGIEVTDELDEVLFEEAIMETATRRYINERGRMNGIKNRRQKDCR